MPYKRCFKYLRSECKKPKSTIYKYKKKTIVDSQYESKKCKKQKVESIKRNNLIILNTNIEPNEIDLVNEVDFNNPEDNDASIKDTLKEILDNEVKINIDINNHEDDYEKIEENKLCAALVAMFFSGKFSQQSFKMVTELFKSIYNVKIPSSFDDCAKIILEKNDDEITFTKTWYCRVYLYYFI